MDDTFAGVAQEIASAAVLVINSTVGIDLETYVAINTVAYAVLSILKIIPRAKH